MDRKTILKVTTHWQGSDDEANRVVPGHHVCLGGEEGGSGKKERTTYDKYDSTNHLT